MITRQALKLNWEGTNRILQAAVQKVRDLGVPMSIAVVDEGGHLLGFARTDNGKPHNIRIALAKARATASNRLPTGKISSTGQPLNDHMAIALPLAAGTDMFVTFTGGVPIMVDGHCVGGVGVSGGTGEQDAEVARAGIAAATGGDA
ncbi:MAG: heme-binding protein [candidate division NC10 bacterium]|nr:heme-binding protein [candidate division NC10 bacterium]